MPHCCCRVSLIVVAVSTLSLLPRAPCHHCCMHLVVVATFALLSLSPHAPHCRHHVCLVVVAPGASSLLLHLLSMPYGSCMAAWGAASASTAHLARISSTSTASSIVVAWTTQTLRVSRVRARVVMSANSPPCLLCAAGVWVHRHAVCSVLDMIGLHQSWRRTIM